MEPRDALVVDDDVGETARAEPHAALELDAPARLLAADDFQDPPPPPEGRGWLHGDGGALLFGMIALGQATPQGSWVTAPVAAFHSSDPCWKSLRRPPATAYSSEVG